MAKRPRDPNAAAEKIQENGEVANGVATAAEGPPAKQAKVLAPAPPAASKYNYAVVCSSNINRSMEAHVAFFNHQFRVRSYGAGRLVRLPDPSGDGNNFAFGTPYEKMYQALTSDARNFEFYRKTRLVDILRRNMQIKTAPERWQDTAHDVVADHDVVVCFEQRIYDAVIEDMQSREARDLKPIVIVCMEVKDEPKEAVIGGKSAVKLAQKLEESDDLATEAPDVLDAFMQEEKRRLLFQALERHLPSLYLLRAQLVTLGTSGRALE